MNWFAFILLLLPCAALAADDSPALQYDATPQLKGGVHFEQDDALQPKSSDFRLQGFVPLSSEQGERWVVVTLHNTAGGQRILQNDYLVAEFADGSRRYALNLTGKAAGGETLTRTLNFGYHRFPILRVFMTPQ